MLHFSTVFESEGVQLADVACRHPAGRGQAIEHAGGLALVLVRRGCFIRSVAGVESLLDASQAYAMNPGEEQRFDHPHSDGDDCTLISLESGVVASLWGGDLALPAGPIPVDPKIDLHHRLLLSRALRQDDDPHALAESAIELSACLLEMTDAGRVASGRPSTSRRRKAIADEARQALAGDPDLSQMQLARALSVSPHHLSRTFRSLTGETIARHRMRLRVRAVLEQLAGGERDLGRLAAEVGFSDQSHLSRVIRSETGMTPGVLRHALSATAVS